MTNKEIKPLSLEETKLLEEIKGCCFIKGKYIDENTKAIFYMLCHLEDFGIEYWNLQQEKQKQKEVIDKVIELLGNYKHYSTPDEKQNSDNEDLVNDAFDILKEVSK